MTRRRQRARRAGGLAAERRCSRVLPASRGVGDGRVDAARGQRQARHEARHDQCDASEARRIMSQCRTDGRLQECRFDCNQIINPAI